MRQRVPVPPSNATASVVACRAFGTAVSVNTDRVVHAASTMKLAVMIEAIRQMHAGERAAEDPVRVHNRFASLIDGTPYAIDEDTYDVLHNRGGSAVPLSTLVRRMIVVSSNLATNCVLETIGVENVQATIDRLGAEGMCVRRGVEDLNAYEAGVNNTTTAQALATLLTALARGEAVSPTADRAMIDLLRDQQFREGIPAGLPDDVPVANKTGWTSTVQHDAAIVTPTDGEPYVLVVLTEGFPSGDAAKAFIADVAADVHQWMGAGEGRHPSEER